MTKYSSTNQIIGDINKSFYLGFAIKFRYHISMLRLNRSTGPAITVALFALASTSLLIYYRHYLKTLERDRHKCIHHRRRLLRPEDRYASLNIRRRFLNPFENWEESSWLLWGWTQHKDPQTLTKNAQKLIDESKLSESWVAIQPSLSTSISSEETITLVRLAQTTCFISFSGLQILTDPLALIPDLKPDIILVSHDHNLTPETVRFWGNEPTWYIPLGLRSWFVKVGLDNVVELDWWQEIHHKGRREVVVAAVPSLHSSGHNPFTYNTTLWCSFILKSPSATFFHSGPTNPFPPVHNYLSEKYGPITIAVLPTTTVDPALNPPCPVLTPDMAFQIHELLHACESVLLGDHESIGNVEEGVRILEIGESVSISVGKSEI